MKKLQGAQQREKAVSSGGENGHILSQNARCCHVPTYENKAKRNSRTGPVRLDGNVARRRACDKKFILWDDLLPGFGLRFSPSGTKSWMIQYEERGKQRYRTLGRVGDLNAGAARKRARALLAKVCLDVLPEAPVRRSKHDAPILLFSEYGWRFWNDYAPHWKPNTQKRSAHAIHRDLNPVFGNMPITDINRPDIMRWRDGLSSLPGTYNRAIPVLSIMLGYAEQLGLRPKGSNPCKGIPRYKVRKHERFLSAREYHRLSVMLNELDAERPRVAAAIRLLAFTGARCGEIQNLRWEWIKPPRVELPDSKTGPKTLYLNAPALEVIDGLRSGEDRGLIFQSAWGGKPMNIGHYWRQVRGRAALPDVRLHDLRHSFASVAIVNGVSLSLIGKLLGHALPETTARYAHLSDDSIAEAAERVSGSLASALGLRS